MKPNFYYHWAVSQRWLLKAQMYVLFLEFFEGLAGVGLGITAPWVWFCYFPFIVHAASLALLRHELSPRRVNRPPMETAESRELGRKERQVQRHVTVLR